MVSIIFFLCYWKSFMLTKAVFILGVLRSGFLRPITEKQNLPIRSLIPIFLKHSFLSCRIFHSYDPINIFRHLFRAWISFWKSIPLICNSCDRGFLIWRVEECIFRHFSKNIYLSNLNVWSCTAFLFWQSFNCCTIAYTQPDFISCMWDGPFTSDSHILRLQCVCSPCTYPTLSHGNSYVFYEVANLYEFVRPHLYDLVWFV